MNGFGEAVAFGAATIVNAIATGKGAAFGVDLWTKAKVKLTNEVGVIKGRIISEPNEDVSLIEKSVQAVLKYFKVDKKFGATVETESNIPIAKGMKSSSVAANALVLATVDALDKTLSDFSILNLSVEAAINAKTTITGAFDDASASYFGNIVVTDNRNRKILKKFVIEKDYTVLFHVPPKKSYTFTSNVDRMKIIARQIEAVFNQALNGYYWEALTLNGLLYSSILGYDNRPAIDALEAGAVASGLSGKGPAVVAVVPEERADAVIDAWQKYEGEIIWSKINRSKAHAIRRK